MQQTIPSRPALNLAEWQTPTPPGYCHDCGRDCGFPGHLADDPRPDDAAEVIARAARHALLTEILPEDGALPPAMAGRVTARLAVLVRNFTTPAVTS